jgi:ATP-dependent DNA helicase RecG
MSSKLPINLDDLLGQRKVEGERVEYKKGWNADPITRTLRAFANDFENLSIEVRISPDDLVVLSFPGPDRSIRMADLRAGKAVSRRYRNRRIGDFLKELDLTEGRSTGISKVLKVMNENGSAPPEFETDGDRSYFLIRLPAHPKVESKESARADTKGKTSEKTSEKILTEIRNNRKCLSE